MVMADGKGAMTWLIYIQVEYFKKRRVADYKKEQTIKRIEAEGGDVLPPLSPQSR